MKQTIRLSENEFRSMVKDIVNEMVNEKNNVINESVDEGLLGMAAGAVLDNVVIQKVVDVLANILKLDRNGVLYRVLSSKLFAMALGNEIQNSIKLKKQAKKQAQSNGNVSPNQLDMGSNIDIFGLLQSVKGGNEQAIPMLLGMSSR